MSHLRFEIILEDLRLMGKLAAPFFLTQREGTGISTHIDGVYKN